MKKFWILVSVLIISITLTACGQKTYAGVQLDKDKYTQLMMSKENINHLLATLKGFNYRKEATAEAVYAAADKVMAENTKGLTIKETEQVDIQVDNSPHGIKGIIQDAVKNKYAIDSSVASQFHDNFDVIIEGSAKAVSLSENQKQKLVTQLNKDLKIEQRLNHLGTQHE